MNLLQQLSNNPKTNMMQMRDSLKNLPADVLYSLAKDIYLKDLQMRNDDRHRVQVDIYNKYSALVKIILSIASFAFGGSTVFQFQEKANIPTLIIAWIFLVCTIALIVYEIYFSIKQSESYSRELAKNDDEEVPEPNNEIILRLIMTSAFFLIVGLIFLVLSLSIPACNSARTNNNSSIIKKEEKGNLHIKNGKFESSFDYEISETNPSS